jgi:hypothetical protein
MSYLIPTKTLVSAIVITLVIAVSYQALRGAVSRYRHPLPDKLQSNPGQVSTLNGLPADAQSLCAFDSAGFATLFASGKITKNGLVKPANSLNFGGILDPNCRFYSWAEQMFLWATSPAPGQFNGPGERVFDSPAFFDVSPPDSNNHRSLIPNEPGTVHAMSVFRRQKGPETNQGEADNSVLLSQHGSLVYYSIMVNDVYAYLLTGLKTGGIIPLPDMFGRVFPHFPTTPGDLAQITGLARTKGATLADSNALAIVLKASWVEASTLKDPRHYIREKAIVPVYNKSNHDTWRLKGTRRTTLALVGLHVVGSMPNHPELIWATFEHYKNTPNAGYTYVNTSGSIVPMPRNTSGHWLFCADGASAPFNQEHMHMTGSDIGSNTPFHISASNTIRWKPFGNAADFFPGNEDPDVAYANTKIIAINNSVHRLLRKGDVRTNYNFIGATWTFDGSDGNLANGAGTKRLSNTTMETYQQGIDTLASGGTCFSCHTGDINHSSHIFANTQPLFDLSGSLAAKAARSKQTEAMSDPLHSKIASGPGQDRITLYPNPAKDLLTVTITSGAAGNSRILISDIQGKTLIQQQIFVQDGTTIVQLPITRLPAGIYLLQLLTAQGRTMQVSKFIKQ